MMVGWPISRNDLASGRFVLVENTGIMITRPETPPWPVLAICLFFQCKSCLYCSWIVRLSLFVCLRTSAQLLPLVIDLFLSCFTPGPTNHTDSNSDFVGISSGIPSWDQKACSSLLLAWQWLNPQPWLPSWTLQSCLQLLVITCLKMLG